MSLTIRSILIICGILGIVIAMALMPIDNGVRAYHSDSELRLFRQHSVMNPVDSTHYFPTSAHCNGCHSTDPEGFAMTDNNNNDVNMFDAWASSMMANSAKDPFWRAKVSHETLTNPDYKAETEDKCTACHAPMGHYTSRYHGNPHYGLDDLLLDSFGLDGVSCAVCHQMSEVALGDLNSGLINFDTINRAQYGPYPIPFAGPMTDFVGFTPVYSEHILDAGICASCHTLVTEVFDPATSQPTGDTYVEQATYHEWLNSQYNTDNISCQSCHLPQILDSIVISDNFNFLPPRSPYGLHELVGGNTMMLQLMKSNRIALGIQATGEDFDKTIAATFNMLQNKSIDINLSFENSTLDSLFIEVELKNKAGHKFPSGYPSRRAFIELLVMSSEGDTIFHSGKQDNNYELVGLNPYFEPHYDVINQEDQVQIYEIVPADINGNFTSLLERAAYSLKDNRLPPLGFTTSHAVYDTTLIVGNALTDSNFNFDENNVEGSATDQVRYHIPRSEFNGGFVQVIARVHYQSVAPRFLKEMFEVSTPEIETFRDMYNESDQSPVLVGTATLDSVFLEFITPTKEINMAGDLKLSPNPTNGQVNISIPKGQQLLGLEVYGLNGKLIGKYNSLNFELPAQQGVYVVRVKTDKGEMIGKVVRN